MSNLKAKLANAGDKTLEFVEKHPIEVVEVGIAILTGVGIYRAGYSRGYKKGTEFGTNDILNKILIRSNGLRCTNTNPKIGTYIFKAYKAE